MFNENYPAQRLLDHLTRQDELLIHINESLRNLNANLSALSGAPAQITVNNIQNLQKQLLEASVVPYSLKQYAMDTAVQDQQVNEEGAMLVSASDGSLDGVTIRFNNQSNNAVPLKYFNWQIPFFRFYVTWPAQANKTLFLAIGRQNIAVPSLRTAQSGPVTPANEVLYNAIPGGAGTFYSDMFNFQGARRLLLFINNGLDVAVTVQAIGNIEDATATATTINGIIPVASTAQASIGLAYDDWHPFVGIQIVLAVPPVLPAANLIITACVQE